MRRSFSSHSQCAHVWAQQTQDSGYAKNVSFDGTTFYSYGTPIANFVTDKDGVAVVLFTERSYSNSSGQHLNHARGAVAGAEYGRGPNCYVVPHLCVEGGWSNKTNIYSGERDRVIASHRLNLAWMLKNYNEQVASAKRARKYRFDHEQFDQRAARMQRYAERFEVDLEAAGVTMPDVEADWQAIEAAEAARNTPQAIAKREKAASRRHEHNRQDFVNVTGRYHENWNAVYDGTHPFSELDEVLRDLVMGERQQVKIELAREAFRKGDHPYDFMNYNPGSHGYGFIKYFTDDDKAARDAVVGPQIEQARQDYRMVTGRFGEGHGTFRDPWFVTDDDKAARRDRLVVIDQDRLAAWREGAAITPYRGLSGITDRHSGALLRVSRDGTLIQTSWGANFPTEHGKRAFPCILRMRAERREYQRNGHAIPLGHFTIDRIDAEGNVTAGCHYVRWEEIERIARELDLLPPEGVAAA